MRGRRVAFCLLAVPFEDNTGHDKQEGKDKRDSEADEHDSPERKVLSCYLLAANIRIGAFLNLDLLDSMKKELGFSTNIEDKLPSVV